MAEQHPNEGIRGVGRLLHAGSHEHDVPRAALHLGEDSIQERLELERRCVLVNGNVQRLSIARYLPWGCRHLEIVGTPEAQSNMRRKAMHGGPGAREGPGFRRASSRAGHIAAAHPDRLPLPPLACARMGTLGSITSHGQVRVEPIGEQRLQLGAVEEVHEQTPLRTCT
jgi:hypothetical protein